MATVITGKISIDGVESDFVIGTDGGWQQWGAVQERLYQSVPMIESMVRGLLEDEHLRGDDEDEY